MSKKKIRAAVIGVGNMGRHHARIYKELEGIGVALVAVCDSDFDTAKSVAKENGCKYYQDSKEMFGDNHIDLVSIVVPTPIHKNVLLSVISYKPHILIEKPLAPTLADAKAMIKAVSGLERVLAVGHVERYNPAVEKLKSLIDGGSLGKINSLISRRVGVAPPKNKEVGVTVDLAIHDIDVFHFLLDAFPKRVSYHKKTLIGRRGEDCVSIFMDFGFASGFIQANWITPIKIRKLSVTGTRGYAELDYMSQELVTYDRLPMVKKLGSGVSFSDVQLDMPSACYWPIPREEPLKREITDIIECIRSGNKPRIGFAEGLKALEVALLCNEKQSN